MTLQAVAFIRKLVNAYGVPREIRSDNGPAFCLNFKE